MNKTNTDQEAMTPSAKDKSRPSGQSVFRPREKEGNLFNANPSPGKRQPDMRGTIQINGVFYDVSGWWKTSRNNGRDFLTLRFKEQAIPNQEKEE